MIMDVIIVTPKRLGVVAFVQAYAVTPASFIAVGGPLLPPFPTTKFHGDKKKIQIAAMPLCTTLKGETVGIASGTAYALFVDKYFKGIVDIKEHNNSADAIFGLQAERIGVVFDDTTFASTTLSRPENNNLALSGPPIGGSIWGGGEAIGVRPTDTDLRAKPDNTIQAVLIDRAAKELGKRWFRNGVTP